MVEVHKFGGASYKDQNSIKITLKRIQSLSDKSIVVTSAFYGVTDHLHSYSRISSLNDVDKFISKLLQMHNSRLDGISEIKISRDLREVVELYELLKGYSITGIDTPRFKDLVISFGEQISAKLLSNILDAPYVDPAEFLLTTDEHYSASVLIKESKKVTIEALLPLFEVSNILIVPGYFGKNSKGEISLLGRSGTDYSAAVIANMLNATKLVIWKDVTGFMSGDPRVVGSPQIIKFLNYSDAADLAFHGAKLLHPKSIHPARELNIPIVIRNLFDEISETVISDSTPQISNITYKSGLKLAKYASKDLHNIFQEFLRKEQRGEIEIVLIHKFPNNSWILYDDFLNEAESYCIVYVKGEFLRKNPIFYAEMFKWMRIQNKQVIDLSVGGVNSPLELLVRTKDVDDVVKYIHSMLISF